MIAILLLLGLVTGSALTVVLEQPLGSGWFRRTRSQCPFCHHALGVRDLVPIVSFLMQKGRCRYCQAPIPRWHLLAEVAAVVLFLLAGASGARGVALGFLLVFLVLLLALAVADLRFWVLPDAFVVLLALAGAVRSLLLGSPTLLSVLLGGALGLSLLGSITLLTRERAMGWGDVKLAGAMGVVLGWGPLLAALLIAFLAGGLVGALLILGRRATLKSHLPFGPFLAGATALLLLVPELPFWALRYLGFP